MSRRVDLPVRVACDEEGTPLSLALDPTANSLPILSYLSHWREWFAVLDGEPERGVWRVETARGVCELHCLRFPQEYDSEDESEAAPGTWLLARWAD